MRKFLLISLLLLLAFWNYAQLTWRNPLPQGNDLKGLWMIDNNTGYAVGHVGTVIKTTDGGLSWEVKNLIDIWKYVWFQEVCFPDPDTGYVVDNNGLIYKTTDAGMTWDTVHDEYYNYLNDIYFTDPQHGVVACDGGQTLITFNGGVSWLRQVRPDENNLRCVWFTDADTGYIAGSYGLILKTTDGGISWNDLYSDSLCHLNDIHFTDPSVGLAAGYQGKVLKTADGGTTWTQTSLGDSITIHSIGMFSADTILLAGIAYGTFIPISYPMLFRSVDGGQSWDLLPADLEGYFPVSVFCLPGGTAYAAGYFGLVARSDDYGDTWTVFSSVLTVVNHFGAGIRAIDFPDGETGYAVAGGYESPVGSIIKTTDGGETWFQLDSIFPMNSFEAVKFTSDLKGYIGGYKIYSTFDGGESWICRYTPGSNWNQISSIAFATGTIGVAVGENGLFLRTSDMGQSWAQLTNVPSIHYYSVCFTDDTTGYVSGAGVVLKTTDAGNTWEEVSQGFSFRDIYFIDNQIGYGVKGDNTVAKTTDGAITWTVYDVPTGSPLWAVHFYDADSGFVSGGTYSISSVVFKTTNGGETWQNFPVPAMEPMGEIVVTENYSVFTAGWYGFLFGMTNGGYTGVKEPAQPEEKPRLRAWPNPFSQSTSIQYTLPSDAEVSLRVFDSKGKEVAVLVHSRQSQGTYIVPLSASGLPSGLYVCILTVNGIRELKKLILL